MAECRDCTRPTQFQRPLVALRALRHLVDGLNIVAIDQESGAFQRPLVALRALRLFNIPYGGQLPRTGFSDLWWP